MKGSSSSQHLFLLLTAFVALFCAHLVMDHVHAHQPLQSPSLSSSYMPSYVHKMLKQQFGASADSFFMNDQASEKNNKYCTNDRMCFNSGTCDVDTGVCQCIPGFKNDLAQGVVNCSLLGTNLHLFVVVVDVFVMISNCKLYLNRLCT